MPLRPAKPKPKPKPAMVMWKPVEQAGETPAVGRSTIETADTFFDTADTEWLACRRRVQAMAWRKHIIEMAETGWHRHETWGYPMEIVPVQIEMADCCKREVDPEKLQESKQAV